jgi:Methyladenine glycosylase
MEPPTIIKPEKLADYLEVITKAVFESGMSWRVVEAKWPGFREAFHGFEPEYVAGLSPDDVDRLTTDTRIIRNRRKIEATIHNAGAILDTDREFSGFGRYLSSCGNFDELSADLRKRFKHFGAFGAYYFLYVVGEPVPPHEEFRAKLAKTKG